MSIPAVAAAFNVKDLTPPRRLVVLAYAYAACEHGYTWISGPKIASRIEMDERSIRRIRRDLAERGLIEVVIEGGGNRPSLVRVLGSELADDDCEKIEEYSSRFRILTAPSPDPESPRTLSPPGPQVPPDPEPPRTEDPPHPGLSYPPTPDRGPRGPRTEDPGEPKGTVREPSANRGTNAADLVKLWSEITGVPATPTVRRRWLPRAAEFYAAAPPGLDFEAFLRFADKNDCREPGGWPYFLAKYTAKLPVPDVSPCPTCENRRWLFGVDDDENLYRPVDVPDDVPVHTVPCPDCADVA